MLFLPNALSAGCAFRRNASRQNASNPTRMGITSAEGLERSDPPTASPFHSLSPRVHPKAQTQALQIGTFARTKAPAQVLCHCQGSNRICPCLRTCNGELHTDMPDSNTCIQCSVHGQPPQRRPPFWRWRQPDTPSSRQDPRIACTTSKHARPCRAHSHRWICFGEPPPHWEFRCARDMSPRISRSSRNCAREP